MSGEWIDRIFTAVLLTVVGLALVGLTTCVNRDWQFQDECRRAGGVVVFSDKIATTGTVEKACATLTDDGKLRPLALPNYRRSTP